MKKWQLIVLSSFSLALLISCAPYRPNNAKAGYCNQLNSQMIFGGSTTNIRQAEIQDAQEPLVQRTYDRKCDN